jgi:RND superfamily putative drug exporter
MNRTNLAGRAGRWSAGHWKVALFGWLAFAVVAVVLGSAVGHIQMKDSEYASGEAATALRILDEGGLVSPSTENVLVHSRLYDAGNPKFVAVVAATLRVLAAQPNVTNLQDPLFKQQGGGQVSPDGHSVLIQFDIKGDPNKAKGKVEPIVKAVAGVETGQFFTVREIGNASAMYEIDKSFSKDFKHAEWLTLPLTVLILVLSFGSLVAAGLPVLLAFSAVLASIGLFSLATHASSADYQSTSAVILLVGMAVGVDYSLFYLRREREERAAGKEQRHALLRAAATSGQAVLISGVTVLIAMAGMFIAQHKLFNGMAFGTMLVVLCAVIGSLTVLPAALSKLGDRVDRGRIPWVGKAKHAAGESRFWGYVLDRVLRRPALSLALGGGLLLLAASPVLSMHTKLPSFTDMPRDLPIVQTYNDLIEAFPGAPSPAVVALSATDVRSDAVATAIADLKRTATATGQMFNPIQVTINRDSTTAEIFIPLAGNGDDAKSLAALATLRNRVLPATLGRLPGVEYAVTGDTAGTRDFNEQMKSRMPWVLAFVLGLAFVLLLATFRSIVIPITAILLNLLSVGAAYGLLVLIFQHSWAEQLLRFTSNYSIVSWLPMFLFVILFGLSMDYHVFILSRIKELHDSGLSTEEAVARGIRRTAGTVTSAAIIMVAVFAIFGTLSLIQMKQMGVGLGLAVLIDATLIRGVLLPSAMKLLGEWNWYMPRWLEWVPSLTPEERTPPVAFGHGATRRHQPHSARGR